MTCVHHPIQLGTTTMNTDTREPIGFAAVRSQTIPQQSESVDYHGDAPLLTIAPTGAGKGVSAIIPTALTHPEPMIIVDPKGEAYQVSAAQRRSMGHQVVCIDPFNYCGEGKTGALNPLDLIDAKSATAVDDAISLATALVSTKSVQDPFWDHRSQQLYAGIILWICAYAPPKQRHLGTLRRILNADDTTRAKVLAAMATSDLWDQRISDSAHILPDAADKTRASILTTAQSHVDFLSSTSVINATASSTVSLDAIQRGDPITIYLVIPPERLESHSQLLRLWLTTIITTITRRRKAPKARTLLVVDEAAQLGNLPALKTAQTLLRGYGLTTWSFWQSLSQIQSIYGTDWRTLFDNAAVVQTFGFHNMTFLKEMADIVGLNGLASLSDVSKGRQIIMRAGEDAMICNRINYLSDLPYKGLWQQNKMIRTQKQMEIAHVA